MVGVNLIAVSIIQYRVEIVAPASNMFVDKIIFTGLWNSSLNIFLARPSSAASAAINENASYGKFGGFCSMSSKIVFIGFVNAQNIKMSFCNIWSSSVDIRS